MFAIDADTVFRIGMDFCGTVVFDWFCIQVNTAVGAHIIRISRTADLMEKIVFFKFHEGEISVPVIARIC